MTKTIRYNRNEALTVGRSYTFTNGTKVVLEDYDARDRTRIGGFTYRITETDDGMDIGRTGQSTANSLYWQVDWQKSAA